MFFYSIDRERVKFFQETTVYQEQLDYTKQVLDFHSHKNDDFCHQLEETNRRVLTQEAVVEEMDE